MQSVNDHGRVLFGQEDKSQREEPSEARADDSPSLTHGLPQEQYPKRPETPCELPKNTRESTQKRASSLELEMTLLIGMSQPEFEDTVRNSLLTEGFLPAGSDGGSHVAASGDGGRESKHRQDALVGVAAEARRQDTTTEGERQENVSPQASLPPGIPQDAWRQEQMMKEWMQRQEAEMEPWEVVRDVLLTWPCSPTKEHIDSCRHLLQQQVFVERWLRTSNRGGTEKVEECVRRLLKHVAWRDAYKVDGILNEDWSTYDMRNEMYVSGLDRQNRPSVTWRVSQHDPNLPRGQTPALGARYLVCTIERARAVNPQSRHIIFICDCSGLQWKNFEHAMFMEAVGMLQENYPDNVAHIFLFPVGWLINSLLGVCRPLLDKDTASKMSVLTEEDVQQGMRVHFSDDQIEVRIGGTLDVTKAQHRRVPEPNFLPRTSSWEDRDGCGVARVWQYKDMVELQRKFVPSDHHHLLVYTPRKLAAMHVREMMDRMSDASSSPLSRGGFSRFVSEDLSEAVSAMERLRREVREVDSPKSGPTHSTKREMGDVGSASTPQEPSLSPDRGGAGATVTDTAPVARAKPCNKALRAARPSGSSVDAAPDGDSSSNDLRSNCREETDVGLVAPASEGAEGSKMLHVKRGVCVRGGGGVK
jgi:hypothetical protein